MFSLIIHHETALDSWKTLEIHLSLNKTSHAQSIKDQLRNIKKSDDELMTEFSINSSSDFFISRDKWSCRDRLCVRLVFDPLLRLFIYSPQFFLKILFISWYGKIYFSNTNLKRLSRILYSGFFSL